MIDIILLYPKVNFYGPMKQKDVEKHFNEPPYNLMMLSSFLRKYGFSVKITDSQDTDYIKSLIERHRPKFVGISCISSTLDQCVKFSRLIKETNSDTKVILGGMHFSTGPESNKISKHLESGLIDIIVYGEGYITLKEILEGKDFSQIKGIIYKSLSDKLSKIITNSSQKKITNMDTLPFPDYTQIDFRKYKSANFGEQSMSLILSKGCKYNCIFCSIGNFVDKTIMLRNPLNIVAEIEHVVKKHNAEYLSFYDQFFTVLDNRLETICDYIIKRKLKIKWEIASRVDNITEQKIKKMKEAGCKCIFYGIESGSQKILDIIKKDITLEQVKKAVLLAKKYKLYVKGSFIIGLPHETKDDIMKTINLLKKLPLNFVQISIATPIPGTEMWDLALNKKGIELIDCNNPLLTTYYSHNTQLPGISSKELKYYQQKAYRAFYFRLGFIKDTLLSRTLKELFNDFKKGLILLKLIYS